MKCPTCGGIGYQLFLRDYSELYRKPKPFLLTSARSCPTCKGQQRIPIDQKLAATGEKE